MIPLHIEKQSVRGAALDAEHLLKLGMAFGGSCGKVLLGRCGDDPAVRAKTRAVEAGLLASGATVFHAGNLPCPVLTFLNRECGTGALCTVLPDGVRFQGETGDWITDFRGGCFRLALPANPGQILLKPLNAYLKKLASVADVEAVKRAGFRIRLKSEGVAADWAWKVLEKLHCRWTDGGEADAVFELSPDGTALRLEGYGPEMTVRMIFEHVLEAFPCDAVLGGSDVVSKEIASGCGCGLYVADGTAETIPEEMRRRGASLGGVVRTGQVIWKKFQPEPDGILAMVLILEMLALSGQRLPEIAESLKGV